MPCSSMGGNLSCFDLYVNGIARAQWPLAGLAFWFRLACVATNPNFGEKTMDVRAAVAVQAGKTAGKS